MWLIRMAWKNLWRNKNRTIVTMASIFFAVILSILANSLQQGIFDNLVRNVVSFYTGYIQVHKQGYWDERILDNSFMASAETEQIICADNTIGTVTPRLEAFALISSLDITKGCMVTGIDTEKEDDITRLSRKLIKGDYLNKDDYAVMLSEGLAQRLKVSINDTIVLIGQGYHGATAAGKYPVRGLLRFGSPQLNYQTLIMPLEAAQDLYSAYGMVSSYILLPNTIDDLDSIAAKVQSGLGKEFEVMTWEEIMPDIKQHISSDTNSMKIISGILYLLICFGIFGTLLMMMIERRFEMGMLVAIGMKKSKLALLLLFESVLTVSTGCLLGMLAAIPVVYYFNKNPLRFGGDTAEAFARFGFEPVFPTSTDPDNFIYQGVTVLALGLLLSLYPIYKAIVNNPLTAMRR
jgi:ABC-type lipoprotein release transport system permease subunit